MDDCTETTPLVSADNAINLLLRKLSSTGKNDSGIPATGRSMSRSLLHSEIQTHMSCLHRCLRDLCIEVVKLSSSADSIGAILIGTLLINHRLDAKLREQEKVFTESIAPLQDKNERHWEDPKVESHFTRPKGPQRHITPLLRRFFTPPTISAKVHPSQCSKKTYTDPSQKDESLNFKRRVSFLPWKVSLSFCLAAVWIEDETIPLWRVIDLIVEDNDCEFSHVYWQCKGGRRDILRDLFNHDLLHLLKILEYTIRFNVEDIWEQVKDIPNGPSPLQSELEDMIVKINTSPCQTDRLTGISPTPTNSTRDEDDQQYFYEDE